MNNQNFQESDMLGKRQRNGKEKSKRKRQKTGIINERTTFGEIEELVSIVDRAKELLNILSKREGQEKEKNKSNNKLPIDNSGLFELSENEIAKMEIIKHNFGEECAKNWKDTRLKKKKLEFSTEDLKQLRVENEITEEIEETGITELIEEIGEIEEEEEVEVEETIRNKELYIDAKELLKNGVVTMPLLNLKEVKKYRTEFQKTIVNFPELKKTNKNPIPIKWSFGALGNPSSFHNELVRELRLRYGIETIDLAKKINQLQGTDLNYFQFFDRMCYRRKGTTLGAESIHKDVLVHEKVGKNDSIFGGWLNLSDKSQFFCCQPGTHKDKGSGGEFAKIFSEREISEFNKNKKLIRVKPGHIIIFYQNITHEVHGSKIKEDSIKWFTGFALTENNSHFFSNQNEIIESQGVPFLPSGMFPTMYFDNNWRYEKQRQSLTEWSQKTFINTCLVDETVKSGSYKGNTYKVVDKKMKSLEEYSLPLYPEYKEFERSLLKPNKEWLLPKTYNSSEFIKYTL
jgi:hypothetical protein